LGCVFPLPLIFLFRNRNRPAEAPATEADAAEAEDADVRAAEAEDTEAEASEAEAAETEAEAFEAETAVAEAADAEATEAEATEGAQKLLYCMVPQFAPSQNRTQRTQITKASRKSPCNGHYEMHRLNFINPVKLHARAAKTINIFRCVYRMPASLQLAATSGSPGPGPRPHRA
jgi:hypothetical protein